MQLVTLKNYWGTLPDLSLSHVLLRLPLAIVFLQQGLSKFPVDPAVGAAFGLPLLVWWVVCYGEIAAGAGLLIGALATLPRLRDIPLVAELGDLITRLSGITMCLAFPQISRQIMMSKLKWRITNAAIEICP